MFGGHKKQPSCRGSYLYSAGNTIFISSSFSATYSVTQPLGSVFILLYSLKIYSFYFITRLFLPSFLGMPHYLSLKSVLYSLIFSCRPAHSQEHIIGKSFRQGDKRNTYLQVTGTGPLRIQSLGGSS